MKNKNLLIYFFGIGIIVLLSSSCKKMLGIPANVPGQLITSEVFSDSITAVSGVTGIYLSASSGNSPLTQFMSLYLSLSGDDLNASDPNNAFVKNALSAGNDAQPGQSDPMWNGFYNNSMIYQCNAAIEGITASPSLSGTLKDQLIGECEVVRALSFFCLVNLYGPVPVPLTSDYAVTAKLPRAPVDTVYAQVIRDLVDASNRLGEAYPSAGHARPNKYTAMALLGRVYLFRKEWSNAQAAADAVINSGTYSLETLDNTFIAGNQESIWQILSTGPYAYATTEGFAFLPYGSDFAPQYYLSDNLLDAFEPGDVRRSDWVSSVTVNGTDFFYPYKYRNRPTEQVDGRVEAAVLFRLAEQYLIRAEAKIQLGDLDGGISDINMIRARAGLPNTTFSTKEDLLVAIMHERQTEFFCEWGHRWLDLKRTGTLDAVMSQEKGDSWPSDGHAALYPVPYSQVRLNPGWQQNPGY
jgi:hypothetical protein